MRKYIVSLFLSVGLASPCFGYDSDMDMLVKTIYEPLPTINKFERFCVLTADDGRIGECLSSVPAASQNRAIKNHVDENIGVLREIHRTAQALPFDDPWTFFCVAFHAPEDVKGCMSQSVPHEDD